MAKELNVKHKDLLCKIRMIKSRSPKYEKHFTEIIYTNSRNRNYPCFMITSKARNLLLSSKELSTSIKSIENDYSNIIKALMPYEIISFQKYVLDKYFIDMYIERLNLCIEVYEIKCHKYRKTKDEQRKMEIINYFKSIGKPVKFIEIWEGKLSEGIEKIVTVLQQNNYIFYKENENE